MSGLTPQAPQPPTLVPGSTSASGGPWALADGPGAPAGGRGPEPPIPPLPGSLSDFFVGVLASLHLESLLCFLFIPFTEGLECIYLYLFFQNLKSFASRNRRLPVYGGPGPALHIAASLAIAELLASCPGGGSWGQQRIKPPLLTSLYYGSTVALLLTWMKAKTWENDVLL